MAEFRWVDFKWLVRFGHQGCDTCRKLRHGQGCRELCTSNRTNWTCRSKGGALRGCAGRKYY
eukprot:139488-Amphidinium_carterae.1